MSQSSAVRDFGQAASREFWAGALGAPADMGNTLLNLLIAGGGYVGHKTGLLNQPPELLGPPVGGSEWIAARMRQAGLLTDNRGSAADTAGALAGGLLGSLAGVKPIASGLLSTSSRATAAPATGKIAPRNSEQNASRFVGNDPPATAQRRFELDYPDPAALGPIGSRITVDIDGRPLGPGPIAGRAYVGAVDQGYGGAQALDTATALGIPAYVSSRNALPRGVVGQLDWARGRWEPGTTPSRGADAAIRYANDLTQAQLDRVVSHELGHVIDRVAGLIKQDGLSSELGRLYSELNTRGWVSKWQKGAKPQDFQYLGDDVKRELMAEAIHAYRVDPNYVKTIAPKTAAAIRAAVNPNPLLNPHIQFNSLAPAAGAGLLGAGALIGGAEERGQQ